jgi:hypothetical protein
LDKVNESSTQIISVDRDQMKLNQPVLISVALQDGTAPTLVERVSLLGAICGEGLFFSTKAHWLSR